MRHIAHLGRLLTLFAAFGAAVWGAFALISTSNEFGSHNPDDLNGPRTAGLVFLVAVALYIALGRLLKGDS